MTACLLAALAALTLAACATPQRATVADRAAPTVGQAAGTMAVAPERRSHINIEKPERPHGSTLQMGLGGRRM